MRPFTVHIVVSVLWRREHDQCYALMRERYPLCAYV